MLHGLYFVVIESVTFQSPALSHYSISHFQCSSKQYKLRLGCQIHLLYHFCSHTAFCDIHKSLSWSTPDETPSCGQKKKKKKNFG